MFYKLILEKTGWKFPFEIAELVSVLGAKQHFPSAQPEEMVSWKKMGAWEVYVLPQNLRISISRACSRGCRWSTKISRGFLNILRLKFKNLYVNTILSVVS